MDSTINRSTRTDSYIITNGNLLIINKLTNTSPISIDRFDRKQCPYKSLQANKIRSVKTEAEMQMHVICVD